jgi:hypothetical protein
MTVYYWMNNNLCLGGVESLYELHPTFISPPKTTPELIRFHSSSSLTIPRVCCHRLLPSLLGLRVLPNSFG